MGFWLEDDYGDWLCNTNGGQLINMHKAAEINRMVAFKDFLDEGRAEAEDVPQIVEECEQIVELRWLAELLRKIPEDSGVTITDGEELPA